MTLKKSAIGWMVLLLSTATSAENIGKVDSLDKRQEEVAHRGARVMPFDLGRTTHVFDDESGGGLQTVTANDPADVAQIYLIRDHLAGLANRMARGNFADQAWLHGLNMPGLTELSAGYEKLKISYHVLPGGASLRLASDDPAIAAAIHKYFAAQRADHSAHGKMRHSR